MPWIRVGAGTEMGTAAGLRAASRGRWKVGVGMAIEIATGLIVRTVGAVPPSSRVIGGFGSWAVSVGCHCQR